MWSQAREYDAQLPQRSTMEDADLLLTASTKLSDRREGSGILRRAEAVFEQNAARDLRIPECHYTLTPLR